MQIIGRCKRDARGEAEREIQLSATLCPQYNTREDPEAVRRERRGGCIKGKTCIR